LGIRLAGLSPQIFHQDGLLIYTTASLEVPETFLSVSRSIEGCYGQDLVREDLDALRNAPVILVFCDVLEEAQLQLALWLHKCFNKNLEVFERPPFLLVPHTQRDLDAVLMESISKEVLDAGVDGLVLGERSGLKLLCAVKSEMLKHSHRMAHIEAEVEKRQYQVYNARKVEDEVHDIVWDYLRIRCNSLIPPLDFSIEPCESGTSVGHFTVGRVLGQGSTGQVFRLENADGSNTGQVVKTIAKQERTNIVGLKVLDNEIRIMKQLSSKQWEHPHIIKMYQVYHADTQVLLRMEDGGSRNLYGYLRTLETRRLPLIFPKAKTMIMQALEAMTHLHLGPKVAHRDIKPENLLITDTNDGLHLQLCDFDLARIMSKSQHCSCFCGTFPFMAPELLHPPYDAFAADVWSMGLVFIEVMTFSKIITKMIVCGKKDEDERIWLGVIYDYFKQPESVMNLLESHLRHELNRHIDSSIVVLLESMLNVQTSRRWSSHDIALSLEGYRDSELKQKYLSEAEPVLTMEMELDLRNAKPCFNDENITLAYAMIDDLFIYRGDRLHLRKRGRRHPMAQAKFLTT
jgi:serine/threonine protein kinase